MPLNIPLPGDPGEHLVGASQDYRNILHQIMQNKMKAQELAETGRYHQGSLEQQKRELAQTAKANEQLNQYRMSDLGIQRQEAQRKAIKDKMLQDLMTGSYTQGNDNALNNYPNNMQQNYQQIDRNNADELFKRINSPNPSTQKDKLRDRNNFIEMMNRNLPGNQSNLQSPNNSGQQGMQSKPNMKGMDANKAMLLSGALKLPTKVIAGNLITPFGTFKVGESPDEIEARKMRMEEKKEDAQIKASEQKLQNAENVKTKKEIDKLVPHMRTAWDATNFLRLLIKETKEGGPIQGRLANAGFIDNEVLGAINALSGIVQSNASKAAVARPSGLSLGWAKTFKTDITKRSKYNLGQANSIITDLRSDYNNTRKQYKESTGLDLPQLQPFNDNDPIIKHALNAIKKGADVNSVLERLQQLREKENGTQ